MKILFIAPYLPSSLRVRPYRLIQYLSQNHEITVIGIAQPAWTSRFVDDLRPFCKEIHVVNLNRYSCLLKSLLALPTRRPMSVAYFSSSPMKTLVRRLVHESEFDLIHTEFIRAAPYTADLQGIPKLFDAVDSLALAYERGWKIPRGSLSNRVIAFEEWLKMRSYEPRILRAFNRVVVSSPIDQKYLASDSGPAIELLPNGVDQQYYYWDQQERDQNSIVFVGQMNYYVNEESVLHFYRNIFHNIRKQNPKVRFSIVGADPKKTIRDLVKNPAVEVTGYVPDIRPYITKASVFVCPMVCGSGIQNKLLHAMAMGTPVVTTSLAIQALGVKNGEHILVADEPKQFADAVVSLMANANLRQRISANARSYVQENHNWKSIGHRLETIYEGMI